MKPPTIWDLLFLVAAGCWFLIGLQARDCSAKRNCAEFCKGRPDRYDDSRWDALKGCECSKKSMQTWSRQ